MNGGGSTSGCRTVHCPPPEAGGAAEHSGGYLEPNYVRGEENMQTCFTHLFRTSGGTSGSAAAAAAQ